MIVSAVDVPWWQRLLMRIPAYRRELEQQAERERHTERIRQRSIAVRIQAEQVAADYRKAARAVRR